MFVFTYIIQYIKRMKIIDLPEDILELIRVWLEERSYFVSLIGNNFYVFLCTRSSDGDAIPEGHFESLRIILENNTQ